MEIKITDTPAAEMINAEGQTIAESVYKRKMASIRRIDEVGPIPDADAIEVATVGGWKVVVKKGEFKAGDLAVYCEIDSWIPTAVAPFLTKAGHFPKVYNGVEGQKLRTIRLRKQVSQGLLLPMAVLIIDYDTVPGEICISSEAIPDAASGVCTTDMVGVDVSEILNIQKWEAPPEFTSADARGSFPSFIIKTDQERVQNCYGDVATLFDTVTWEKTEKCEGSSMTVYFRKSDDAEDPGTFGVASRNLDLKESEDNTFWKMAIELDLKNKLTTLGRNIAIQGELCGPGIQGNIYSLPRHMLFVFDVFDIDKFEYFAPDERRELTTQLGLTDAPVYAKEVSLAGKTCAQLLTDADGYSVLGLQGCRREGEVYKANLGRKRVSFKCVSNLYLEKQKE